MASRILQTIMQALETHHCEFLVFKHLDSTVSSEIVNYLVHPKDTDTLGFNVHFVAPDGYLRVVKPTILHATAVSWMRVEYTSWIGSRLLTPAAFILISDCNIPYENFLGAFAGSSGTPDIGYNPTINGKMSEFPTIVLESGWSESQAQLQRDCQLWLEGTAGAVKVVILYKMDPPDRQNQIKATMTFCRYVAGGAPVMISYPIFPPPAQPADDPWITIGELLGGRPPDGLHPETRLPLSMERLRTVAGGAIRQQGHLPAVD